MSVTYGKPARTGDLCELMLRSADQLRALLPDVKSVALVDFPAHQNVGDLMIWAGERRLLRACGLRVVYASDYVRFDPSAIRRLPTETALLLHGGGNLGDLWPDFQDFREHVVAHFPERRILQLPQSIWFDHAEGASRANAVLGAHPSFVLMVRDKASELRARDYLPSVTIVPAVDSGVFALSPVRIRPLRTSRRAKSPGTPRKPSVLALARRDHEVATECSALGVATRLRPDVDLTVTDWGLSGLNKLAWLALRTPGRLVGRRGAAAGRFKWARLFYRWSLDLQCMLLVSYGVRLIRDHRLLITDRLHAAVLGGLIGVPVVALDNRYGKIHDVFQALAGALPSVTLVATLDEGELVTRSSLSLQRGC